MQLKSIFSEFEPNVTLGSVVYAQSFLMIEATNFICITRHVPDFQSWYTNNRHFKNMPIPILTEKNLECD